MEDWQKGLLGQLNDRAAHRKFLAGDLEGYLQTITQVILFAADRYVSRDEVMLQKIKAIKRRWPGAYVVTYRGGLHQHLVDELKRDGYRIQDSYDLEGKQHTARPQIQVILKKVRQLTADDQEAFRRLDDEDQNLLLREAPSGYIEAQLLSILPRTMDIQQTARALLDQVSVDDLRGLFKEFAVHPVSPEEAGRFLADWVLSKGVSGEPRKALERALAKQAGMEQGRLEIAVHGHLLDSVRQKFRQVPNVVWKPISTNSDRATEELRDFIAQDGIRRIVILDETYVPNERQAAWILPEGHASVIIVDGNSAGQLTPEYITRLLQLPEVSAGRIYFLRFEKDRLRLETEA